MSSAVTPSNCAGSNDAQRAVAIANRLKAVRLQRRVLAQEEDELTTELTRLRSQLASPPAPPPPQLVLAEARARLAAGVLRPRVSPEPFQIETVASVLTDTTTCLVYPAGSGKGLTTQVLAACACGRVTIICVPLIGLAHDLYAP